MSIGSGFNHGGFGSVAFYQADPDSLKKYYKSKLKFIHDTSDNKIPDLNGMTMVENIYLFNKNMNMLYMPLIMKKWFKCLKNVDKCV